MRFDLGMARVRSLRRRTYNRDPLGLTCLAALGFVSELFISKKQLLACGKHKFCAAVDAREHPVLEFHRALLWPNAPGNAPLSRLRECFSPDPLYCTLGSALRTGEVARILLNKNPRL